MTVVIQPPERISGNTGALARSRTYCRDLTRREARNFYYGLKLLPEPKRSGMYALYAYMRLADDIADDEGGGKTLEERKAQLAVWETTTRQVIESGRGWGEGVDGPGSALLWPAFGEMVSRYHVPAKVFADMIAGQRQDLEPVAIESFEALRAYCYRVASVVGVASLYVFGFDGAEETLKLGAERGIAFQLTNVLRDVREDSRRGRCYIPRDELARFAVSPDEIAEGRETMAFEHLMRYQIERAQGFFDHSEPLEGRVEADARPTLRAMTAIYRGLLEKIAREPAAVLRRRICLSGWTKLMIAWRAMRGG